MGSLTEKEKIKLITIVENRLDEVKNGLEDLERKKNNYHEFDLESEYSFSLHYLSEENELLTNILKKLKKYMTI